MSDASGTAVPLVAVTAMACEFEAVLPALAGAEERTLGGRRFAVGTVAGRPVGVILAGIGKVAAASAVQLAADRAGAKLVVTAGVAGGLRPSMKVGDTFAVRAAVEYDFDLSEVDGTRVGQLDGFAERELPFLVPEGWRTELLATGDHFRNGDGDWPLLIGDLDAGLRDMEGAAVAHAAALAGVAVAGIKAVSNVRGLGGMVDQYAAHRAVALAALGRAAGPFLAGAAAD